MTTAPFQHQVPADDTDTRLDRWLKRIYPTLTQGQIERLLRQGHIRVDGKRIKSNHRLQAGEEVKVPPSLSQAIETPEMERPQQPKQQALPKDWILYEDKDVLVINKPYGVATQGGSKTSTHIDGMLESLATPEAGKPRLVHRLDKDTSGVLIIAKTLKAATALTKAFQDKTIDKVYWAVVNGTPPESIGFVKLPIRKGDGRYGEQMVVDREHGQPAATDYRVLDSLGNNQASWLELRPQTGRTHQLRVHCQAMKTPIVGDGKYGQMVLDKSLGLGGNYRKLHLHARQVTFTLANGKRKTVTAPLPPHMEETFKDFGFDVATR